MCSIASPVPCLPPLIWQQRNALIPRNSPVAPASSSASACVSPNPLAAPETSTTLSTRLNSGNLLVVPRKVPGSTFSRTDESSWAGGPGGPRPATLGLLPRGGSERFDCESSRCDVNGRVQVMMDWGRLKRRERAARGSCRKAVFMAGFAEESDGGGRYAQGLSFGDCYSSSC